MTDATPTFPELWQDMCRLAASKSKDRSTKVGAVIVGDGESVLSMGWNGFPRSVDDNVKDRHNRPEKYAFTEHAERNAVYNAARNGVRLLGASLYSSHYPCCDCARAIIQSGISRVFTCEPDFSDPHLLETQRIDVSRVMFEEAGVAVEFA